VSLSQEPAFSTLKNDLICGSRDITGEPYAGMSGRHDKFGNAVSTSNGAGPHNVQMFLLSADGTVLTCLPGYWAPEDLVTEVGFAKQLNQVWQNKQLSTAQKDAMFTQMHLAHERQHSPAMRNRSHMQGFDAMYEAEAHPGGDTIREPQIISACLEQNIHHFPQEAFKTTDMIMHERMAKRPFQSYDHFDTASFANYGKWRYDKEEDAHMANGQIDQEKLHNAQTIGDPEAEKQHQANPTSNKEMPGGWGGQSWGSR
jgi:hypothetical protein